MKHNIIRDNKNLFSIVGAILFFALITLVYFNPVLQGKRIKQHDIEMFKGAAQEIVEYRQATGEQTLWTNSMFGGGPAWNISVKSDSNLTTPIYQCLKLGFPHPIGSVFICMLGFFALLLVLDCGFWISFVGAIAYGFTSYLFIIIGAGHNSKAMAMAYMAPVIAGVLLSYKGKYLWGSLLTAFALAFEVQAGHIQITYYLAIIIAILVIAEFISDIKNKRLSQFFKASGALAIAVIIGVLTCSTTLYANYEFGKETTRGKPILTRNESNQTKGLDRDYITQWSYGIGETWTLMIPNAKGGASAYIGNKNSALDKADPRFKQNIAQSSAYWGDQPGTSGPVYVGAIVVFLFLLGALTVKGPAKWGLLIATILSILLSWGKNFMAFTDFFLDYFPGYNKFRAVSMTLVIAEVTMPMLGFLGLAEIVKSPENFKKNINKFWIALGITAGFCLLFFAAPKLFFSFLSEGEAQQFGEMMKGQDGAIYSAFASSLEDVRMAIFRKDAIRSFIFIVLSAIPILLYGKGKLKAAPSFIILAALIIIDMLPIDKRYLNNDNFISKQKYDKPFVPTAADKYILADQTLDFRVVNLTKDVFNDASTSYFHKSVGGYHGAKQRRYQDIITQYMGKEVQNFSSIFRNATTEEALVNGLERQKTLNMMNTKYIIYDPESMPLENPCAFGNAWIADDIRWVETPNDEIDAIATSDLRHTAIINKEFEKQVGDYRPSDSVGQIQLTDYKPNQLTYSFNANEDKIVVFSEVWTNKGWKMFVDGQEHPILRANYLLRSALIPAGQHEIMMEYKPSAYRIGNIVTFVSSLIMLLGLIAAIVFSITKNKKQA